MKIKDFFKKFLPASSRTFNSKIDYLTDLVIKVNNNQLYTEYCIKSLSSSFEAFTEDYKKDYSEAIKKISLMNANIEKLNQLCNENIKISSDAVEDISKSLWQAGSDILNIVPAIIGEINLKSESINNLLLQNESELNDIFTDIRKLSSENQQLTHCVDGIIPNIKQISTESSQRVEEIFSGVESEQKKIFMQISDSNTALSENIKAVSGIKELMIENSEKAKNDILHNIDDSREQLINSMEKQTDNIKKAVADSSEKMKNAILNDIDDSREQLIKVSEKRSTNRSNNSLNKHLWDLAARQTAEYVTDHMAKCITYPNPDKMRENALSMVEIDGLYLEFGVYSGKTINHAAKLKPDHQMYGFDSFEGLPDTWRTGFYKEKFATDIIPEVRENVELVIGWFDETLPDFVAQHTEPCAYIHVDCDLYSSTKTVFKYLKDRIIPGTVIVFDEYFNYPSWEEHEFKAFQEFVHENSIEYEYIGYIPDWEQVAVRIKSVG